MTATAHVALLRLAERGVHILRRRMRGVLRLEVS
jgi:hypothetical protein